MNKPILVDTHAHYYPFCTFLEYFDSAYLNMQSAARTHNNSSSFTAVLCLLETRTSHWYQDLLEMASAKKTIGNWALEVLNETQLLRLSQNNGKELLVLPGQQIITAENLELLIIGSTDMIAHDDDIRSYLSKFGPSHLVIIPWGVGKWLGSRGRIVSELIHQKKYDFALGDNSGRTSLWQYVPQFNQAKANNINIIAGSDPLPIHGQHKKIASYGVILTEAMPQQTLAQKLRDVILNSQSNIKQYGRLDNVFQFFTSQLLLRLRPIKAKSTAK